MLLDSQKFIPKSAVKVSYYDNDGTLVKDATQDQALAVEKLRPGTRFFHRNGNGSGDLNKSSYCFTTKGFTASRFVQHLHKMLFGGNGIGAIANAISVPIQTLLLVLIL